MESKHRGLWVFLAVVGVAAIGCCCVLAALVGIVAPWHVERETSVGVRVPDIQVDVPDIELDLPVLAKEQASEQTFEVGSAPRLTVLSFAGKVTIRAGADGAIRVVATKRASTAAKLDKIQVDMSGEACCVEVKASHPLLRSMSNASVDLEITAPADTILDLRTGAGAIEVRGIRGKIEAETGAGSIDLQGATGPADLTTGVGSVSYEGSPQGRCHFTTGVGGVTVRLPENADVTVNLDTGLGSVHTAFRVSGRVSRGHVSGTIGTGEQATITARSGLGGVDLLAK